MESISYICAVSLLRRRLVFYNSPCYVSSKPWPFTWVSDYRR